jgi:uncharacterized membrane protein YgcG
VKMWIAKPSFVCILVAVTVSRKPQWSSTAHRPPPPANPINDEPDERGCRSLEHRQSANVTAEKVTQWQVTQWKWRIATVVRTDESQAKVAGDRREEPTSPKESGGGGGGGDSSSSSSSGGGGGDDDGSGGRYAVRWADCPRVKAADEVAVAAAQCKKRQGGHRRCSIGRERVVAKRAHV